MSYTFMTEFIIHCTEIDQVYEDIIDMCPNFETLHPKQKKSERSAKFIANNIP